MGDAYCNSDCLPSDYGEGEHYRHCVHDCIHAGERSGVCCHCGDLFLADEEPNGIPHGEYAPDSEAAIARLTAELAAARALLPTEDELDTAIDACAEAVERVCWDPHRFDVAREWLARLEAARVEGEGKP